MANPWEMDWGNQAGPVYGAPPAAPKPRDPLQVAIDEERLDNLRNPKPNLPAGYEMGPDGIARRIPGLPEPAAGGGSANDVKIQQKRASLQSLETQINRVEELYRTGLKDEAFGLLSSLGEFLPTEQNRQFDAASAGLAEQGLSAFRVPGVGAQSDTELRQFVQANRPSASDYDSTIEEKLRQLRVRVDATRGEMGLPPAQWLGQPPAQDQQGVPAPAQSGGLDQSRNLAEIEAPSGDQLTRSTGGTQTVDNPALTGVRGEYLRRLEAGQSPQEVIAFLRQAGISDPKILASAVQQVNFRKQNPNVPIANYNTSSLDDMDVPLSATESMMNDAAQSPLGAYGMNAGQAASLNTLDELAPNQERAQLALRDSQSANPVASTLGTLSGGLMTALGGEAGLARLGMGAGVGRATLADVAYGAGAGAGASDGNRIGGAATGGLAGLVGSLAGQGLTSTAGKLVGGVSNPSVRAVSEAGVPLTAGQAVGQSGLAGRMVKGVEDRLSGIPVVGDIVNARRAEGVRAMNSKAFDKALEPIGESVGEKIGEEAVAEAQDLVGQAFTRALGGKTAGLDRQFISEATKAKNDILNLPGRVALEVESSIDEVVGSYFDAAGNISGENMQALLRELGQIKRGYKNDPLGHRISGAVGKVEDAVESLFRRQAPDVMPQYDAAKKAFRRLSIVEDAVLRGKNTGGQFTPGQLGMADRANAKKFGGAHSAAAGRGEFHDFQRPMQEVLPNQVPDSGTAGRLIVPGALVAGGAGAGALGGDAQGGAGAGLGLAGLLSLAYSRRGQGLLTAAAVKRGPKARAVGEAVKGRKRLGGAAAATLAVQGTYPGQ